MSRMDQYGEYFARWREHISKLISMDPGEEIVVEPGSPSQLEMIGECMETAEIVRKILKHCSSRQLLELSDMNKVWNYEARSLLRDRGDLTARKKWYQFSCQYLTDLALDVQKMNVVPFRGICIELGDMPGSQSVAEGWRSRLFPNNVGQPVCPYRNEHSTAEQELIIESIFRRVQFKHLSIKFYPDWETHTNCPGFLLLTKILNNSSSGLEELSVRLQSEQRELFVEQVLQNSNLASLKTFELLDCAWANVEDYTDLVKVLVSRAPNLQVLYTECRVNLEANLLAGTSAVHVTNYRFCAIREIPESVAGDLRMKKINLEAIQGEFSLERFNRITPMLLQNSRTLLNTVVMNGIFLVPLMQYAICLENVKKLKVVVDSGILERSPTQLLTIMKNFDFTRIFPRLVGVEVNYTYPPTDLSQEFMNAMVEAWNGPLDEPKVDRGVNIKSLNLVLLKPLDEISFGFLVQMVPHIEKLVVQSQYAHDIPFRLLWQQSWVNLQDIQLSIHGNIPGGDNFNLDDMFCGIDPEEVDFLRQQDEEYLRRVNIVAKPSISYLTGLRTFGLRLSHSGGSDSFAGQVDDPTFLFSKVTGLLAFKRCPALTVTLDLPHRRTGQDVRHLEPYAIVP